MDIFIQKVEKELKKKLFGELTVEWYEHYLRVTLYPPRVVTLYPSRVAIQCSLIGSPLDEHALKWTVDQIIYEYKEQILKHFIRE